MEEEKELQEQQQQAQEAGQQPALEEDVIGNEEEGNAQDGARTVSVKPPVAANPAPAASEAYAGTGLPGANEGSASVTNTGKTSLSTEQGSEQTTQDKVLTPAGEEAMRQAGERVDDRQAAYQAAVASNEVPSTKSYYEPAHARLLAEEEQAQRERMDAQARRDASRQARREWKETLRDARKGFRGNDIPMAARRALMSSLRDTKDETVEEATERIYNETLDRMRVDGEIPAELDERTKRRLHRQASREAEMARETRIAEVAERLGYHYVPEPVYRRQQLLKAIISGLGDLGALAARSVTARNSGIILPFDTLTAGTVRAREMGDKEREAVRAGIRQLAGEQEAAALESLEQAEKDRLAVAQNPNYWQTVTSKRTEKNKGSVSNEASSTVTKGHKAFKPEVDENAFQEALEKKKARNSILFPGKADGSGYAKDFTPVSFEEALDIQNNIQTKVSGLARLMGKSGEPEEGETDIDTGLIDENGAPFMFNSLKTLVQSINGLEGESRAKAEMGLNTAVLRTIRTLEYNLENNPGLNEEQKSAIRDIVDGYYGRLASLSSSQGGGMVPSSEEEAMGGDMDW